MSTNPVRNVLFNGLRLVVSIAASIVSSALIVRKLGPENSGLYAYVLWLSGILVGLAHLGLPTSLTKHVSEFLALDDRSSASRMIRSLLRLQLLIVMVILSIGAVIVRSFPQLKGDIFWIALMLVIPQAMQQTLAAALAGAQRYSDITFASICGSTVQVLLLLLAAQFQSTVMIFLVVLLIANVIQAGLTYWLIRREFFRPNAVPRVNPASALPGAIGFAGTIYYLVLLDMVVWQRSEFIFLKRYSTLKEITFYSIAFLMAGKLNQLVTTMTSTLLPLQTESYFAGGLEKSFEIQTKALRSIHMALAPLICSALLLGRPFIILTYGGMYNPVVPVFSVMLISPIAAAFADVGVAISYATGKQKSLIAPLTLTALLNVALAALLVPREGAIGAATANCAAQAIEAMFLVYLATRILPLSIPWSRIIKIYLTAVIAFLPAGIVSLVSVSKWSLFSAALLGFVFYPMILRGIGEIEPQDWVMVKEAFSGKLHVVSA